MTNQMEINIIKLMRATLGDIEFTNAIENRISQRLNSQRQTMARFLGKQLPLFPEISLFENPVSLIRTELEGSNIPWNLSSTLITAERISS